MYLFKDFCVNEYLNNDTCNNVDVDKTANETNDDVYNGNPDQKADCKACEKTNDEVNEDANDEAAKGFCAFKRKGENFLQHFHDKKLLD